MEPVREEVDPVDTLHRLHALELEARRMGHYTPAMMVSRAFLNLALGNLDVASDAALAVARGHACEEESCVLCREATFIQSSIYARRTILSIEA